jgi:hypothetical protein
MPLSQTGAKKQDKMALQKKGSVIEQVKTSKTAPL